MIPRIPPILLGKLTPWLILGASLAFTGAATAFVGVSASQRDEARFLNAVQNGQDRIAGRLEVYLATLGGGAALFGASDTVTREEFRSYVERLDLQTRYAGIQGIGWSERVAAGLPGPVDERHAIRYLEPMDPRNEAAIGYDMYGEATRRAAMRAARDGARPALSGRVTLVQEIYERKQAGFLLYLPVYRGAGVPPTVEARRERLEGFVYSPFRADDLFAGLFGSEAEPRVSVRVYDGATLDSAALLHASQRKGQGEPERTAVRALDIAGRRWTVLYASEPAFEEGSAGFLVPSVLFTGLLASALLFGLAWSQSRARLAAERANRSKSDFLSAMSHELRTPLNAIAGYVDLLDLGIRGPTTEAQREDLRRIKRAQEHLLSLINDVLHFAKLEAGHLEVAREAVPVGPLLAELDEMVAPLMRAKGLDYHHGEIDPALRLWGDPNRVRQILLNLVTNAVKFTPAGGRIDVSVRARRRGRGAPRRRHRAGHPARQAGGDLRPLRAGRPPPAGGIAAGGGARARDQPRAGPHHGRGPRGGERGRDRLPLPPPAAGRARVIPSPTPTRWWPAASTRCRSRRG